MKYNVIKRLISTVLIIGFVSVSFSCDNAEQKKKNDENIEKAEAKYQDYLSDKYGFEAELISSEVVQSYGLFGTSSTNNVLLELEYNGKEFNVLAECWNGTVNFADNYQAADIRDGFKDYIEKRLPGIYKLKMEIEGSYFLNYYKADQLYTGDNILDFMDGKSFGFKAYYIDKNFSDNSQFEFLNELNDKCTYWYDFISCRSKEAADKVYAVNIANDYEYIRFAPYISNYRNGHHNINGRGDEYYEEFNIHEAKGFMYLTEYNDDTKIDSYGCSETSYLEDHVPVSPMYTITSDYNWKTNIKVFFPISDIKMSDTIDDIGTSPIYNYTYDLAGAYKKIQESGHWSFHQESFLVICCDYAVFCDYVPVGTEPVLIGIFKR